MKSSKALLGIALLSAGLFFLAMNFLPAMREETRYFLRDDKPIGVVAIAPSSESTSDTAPDPRILSPIDENFGIIIPKIRANAKVIPDVDSQNSAEYQRALTRGVAHAKGTALPGEAGNVFIFAHSGENFYEANIYNAVFYLLGKLEKGDEIDIFYDKEKISYAVTEIKVVNADETSYLENRPDGKRLTLMTCWPMGTNWKRLVVIAEQTTP